MRFWGGITLCVSVFLRLWGIVANGGETPSIDNEVFSFLERSRSIRGNDITAI